MISEVAQINAKLKKIKKLINKRNARAKDNARKRDIAQRHRLKHYVSYQCKSREQEFQHIVDWMEKDIKLLEAEKLKLEKNLS